MRNESPLPITGKVETASYWRPVTASSTYRLLPLSKGVLSTPVVSNYLRPVKTNLFVFTGHSTASSGSRGRSRDHWRPVLSCQNKHFPILTASRAVASKGTDRIYVVKMSGNCVAEKKKSAIKWNSDEISKFLEVFQSYELLWNCRHREYVDKQKRESAIHRLMTDIQKQGIQVPDICFLRNKIKVIKTTYRQERVKVEESKSSGKGTEDLYVPRLTCKLAKVEQSIAKLQKIAENRPKSTASASKKQDEYDAFAQHMATQLRTLPLRSFIILQEQFQSLITKERLKTMNPPPSPIMSTGSSYDDNDDSELQPYSQSIFQDHGTFYTELN
ncbi:hypothetical protein J6590_070691 [Homalodisca vitripennis]|nr:hypothetical protein J6590_070691 [Homalodisca vitripennis]